MRKYESSQKIIYKDVIYKYIHDFYNNNTSYIEYLKHKYACFKYICVFGAGNIGIPTAARMVANGINVDFFCDNNIKKQGMIFEGIPCISIDELIRVKDETVVITCGRAFEEITAQLKLLGFTNLDILHENKFRIREYMNKTKEDLLIDNWASLINTCEDEKSKEICLRILYEWCQNESRSLNEICTDDQYFCKEIINLGAHEIVVDGGAYTGDTLEEYMNLYGDFDKYFMFELSKSNFLQMKLFVSTLNIQQRNKICCINCGISDKNASIVYYDGDEGACIKDINNEGVEGDVVTIDKVCAGNMISFIKMDIEGSELSALRGAKYIIKKYHPKLAICLYHNPDDMWEIPRYIKELDSSYRIYIRHHTDLMNETVCYAI